MGDKGFTASGVKCPYIAENPERLEFEARVRNICIPDHPDREALKKKLQYYFKQSAEKSEEEIAREEFDTLIEYTAEDARRNGFVPTLQEMFNGDLNKVKAHRDNLFDEMKDGGDKIDLEKYQEWTLKHIRGKVEQMKVKPASETEQEATAFVKKLKSAQKNNTWDSALREYKEMFQRSGEIMPGTHG